MYWVSDKEKALSLIRKATDMESNNTSEMITTKYEEINLYLDENKNIIPIFENIQILLPTTIQK